MTEWFYVILLSMLQMIICEPDPQFRKELKIEDISPNPSSKYQSEIANKLRDLLSRYSKQSVLPIDKKTLKNVGLTITGYVKHLENKTKNKGASDGEQQFIKAETPNQIEEISALLEKMLVMNKNRIPVSEILKTVFEVLYSTFPVKTKQCMDTAENVKKLIILSYNSYLDKINSCQHKITPLNIHKTEDYFMGSYRMLTHTQQMETKRNGYKNHGGYTLQMQPIAELPTTFMYSNNINLVTPKQFLFKPKIKGAFKKQTIVSNFKDITINPKVMTSDHTKVEHHINIKTFGTLDVCEQNAIHDFLEFTGLLIQKKYSGIYMACSKTKVVLEGENEDRALRLDQVLNHNKKYIKGITVKSKVNNKYVFKRN